MRTSNTRGCTRATCRRRSSGGTRGVFSTVIGRWAGIALAAAVLASGSAPALGQARPPSPDDALRAHARAEPWVRQWRVPPDALDPPRAAGACVTLRAGGRTVGRGAAWSADPFTRDGASPAPLATAAAAALAEAGAVIRVPNDAAREDSLRLVAADLLVSVELAGPLSPFEPATWEDAEADLRPGLDGVAVRIVPPERDGRAPEPGPILAMFPSQMLLTGTLPHRALAALCAQAIGDGGAAAALEEPAKLRDRHAIRMFRFRAAHAAQPAVDRPPVLLYRGQRLIPPVTVLTVGELREFGGRLAAWIERRPQPAPGTTDAGPRALGAYALSRWAAVQPDASERARLASAAVRLADGASAQIAATWAGLETGGPGEAPARAPAVALASLAVHAAAPRQVPGADERLAEVWSAVHAPGAGFTPAIPSPIRGLLVLAALGHPGGGRVAAEAPGALRAGFADPAQIVGQMPWLGWAELRRAGAGDVPAAAALRQMRDQLWKHQVSIADAGEDALDMCGGIVFTGGLREGRVTPYPTWQCVRPLAFAATMLGDPRLTEPAERPREIARLMQALRYLRQLETDDACGWMLADAAAVGGVRAAVWDQSQPADATALTLLCVAETLNSIAALERGPPAGAPGPRPAP